MRQRRSNLNTRTLRPARSRCSIDSSAICSIASHTYDISAITIQAITLSAPSPRQDIGHNYIGHNCIGHNCTCSIASHTCDMYRSNCEIKWKSTVTLKVVAGFVRAMLCLFLKKGWCCRGHGTGGFAAFVDAIGATTARLYWYRPILCEPITILCGTITIYAKKIHRPIVCGPITTWPNSYIGH